MTNVKKARRNARRNGLLAAISAAGFSFCMISTQYAQAAPKTTDLQVEEVELVPQLPPLAWFAVGWIAKEVFDALVGEVGPPQDSIEGLPEKPVPCPVLDFTYKGGPMLKQKLGQTSPETKLTTSKSLSTRDAHRILN